MDEFNYFYINISFAFADYVFINTLQDIINSSLLSLSLSQSLPTSLFLIKLIIVSLTP